MAFLARLALTALIGGAVYYHARQLRMGLIISKRRRPNVFLVVKGDPDESAKRRPVVLRNGGDLPARDISLRVVRDAMIWAAAPREGGREERVAFSALPICHDGLIGLPPGNEYPVAYLTPAGRWMEDRDQKLECVVVYFDGEGARYEESIGLEYLA